MQTTYGNQACAIFQNERGAGFIWRNRPDKHCRLNKRNNIQIFPDNYTLFRYKFEKNSITEQEKAPLLRKRQKIRQLALHSFLPGGLLSCGQIWMIRGAFLSISRPPSYPYGRCDRSTVREEDHGRADMLPRYPRRWAGKKADLSPSSAFRSRPLPEPDTPA